MNTYGLFNHLILTVNYSPSSLFGPDKSYRISFYVNPDHAIIEASDGPPSNRTRVYKTEPPSSLYATITNHLAGEIPEHSEDLYCAIDNWISRSPKAPASLVPADWLPIRDPALQERIEIQLPASAAPQ